VYETFRRLRVTVSENRLTQVRVSIPHDLFSRVNGDVRYYSIIVYQDGGFPDKPERRARDPREEWPPVTRTWAEAAPYPFILAYQTTPDRWMPFKSQSARASACSRCSPQGAKIMARLSFGIFFKKNFHLQCFSSDSVAR